MESNLTQLEMDAVFQLIQLSCGGCADDLRLYWLDFPVEKEEVDISKEELDERSVGETLSSSLIDREKCLLEEEDDVLPRRKTRFGSLLDIYRKTRPSINKRAKKRPRF